MLTLLLALQAVWARFPASIERDYVGAVGPALQRGLTAVSARTSVSLAEGVEAAAIVVSGAWLLWTVGRVVRRHPLREVALDAALTVWVTLSAVGFLFYAVWGLSYSRPPADERLGWSDPQRPLAPIEVEELRSIAHRLIEQTNTSYLSLHGVIDAGVPSETIAGLDALDAAIDAGFVKMVAAEGLNLDVAAPRGPAKPVFASLVLTYLGIGGFYFPFTGEANFNAMVPEWQLAHTIAHEKAHQRFVASEDEANFFGFLASYYAEDSLAQYSTWLFAQRQVLVALGETDPYATALLVELRYPGVQRDVDFVREFWLGYQGPAQQVGQTVNDQYLKFNGVAGGVRSYSQSVTLIVEWLRRNPAVLAATEAGDAAP